MKVDMIASTRMRYRTRMMNAGETFQASSRDVKILEAIKKAKVVPAATAPEPAAPLSQEAAPALAPEPDTEEPPPRRRGRRRRVESNTTDSD